MYFVNLKVSPKKARFYLAAIKKLGPAKSLELLMYENTNASEILYKAIKSAISSAKQILKVEDNLLNFKLLVLNKAKIKSAIDRVLEEMLSQSIEE